MLSITRLRKKKMRGIVSKMTLAAMSVLRAAVEQEVQRVGLNPWARRDPRLAVGQIRSVLEGRASKSTTIEALCDALGLEFYIGPKRAIPELQDETTRRRRERRGGPAMRAPPVAAQIAAWPVTSVPPDGSPSPTGCLWFTDGSLRKFRLCPSTITAVWVLDDAMEPDFPVGTGAVADTSRCEWAEGAFFGIRVDKETVIRRAAVGKSGARVLVAQRPGVAAIPWREDRLVVGQVVWAGRFLVPPRSEV